MKIITKKADRVARGGSWYYYVFVTRIAYHHSCSPDCRHDDCGFRITRRINNENNNKGN